MLRVKYLGVPLISSKLLYSDYKVLVEQAREMNKGKAKVSWDSICMPEFEGGPGVRRLADVNVSLTTTYIWSILTHKEPLWVKWVHTYKLIGRSFWDVVLYADMS
nr:reverse transcriptase domain, reverse transcriptase zinc-binding domain protein [Tanacetum cinerariifolium]